MATHLEQDAAADRTGRALRQDVHRKLVWLASGGAVLIVVLALVTTLGHLDTGRRERQLLAVTAAQRLNADANAAREALNGALTSALEYRSGGADRSTPRQITADAQRAGVRMAQDDAAVDELKLPAGLASQAAALRQSDAAFISEVQRIVAKVLNDRASVLSDLSTYDAMRDQLDGQRSSYASVLQRNVDQAAQTNSRSRAISIWVVWSVVAVALGALMVMFVTIRRSVLGVTRRLQDLLSQNENDAARGEFGRRVVEAFDMADDEEAAREVVSRAMTEVSPELPMELLLADSSKAHLTRASQHPAQGAPCCPVGTPFECVAVRRGTAVTFSDSEELHACPKLRDRASGPVSAACVPITFMGRAIGVLHATGEQGSEPEPETVERLARLAAHTGSRIGTLRATRQTQMQAATDSLTGLVNRRTFDNEVRELLAEGRGFALAFGDLDHFKALNDRYGHDAGDRALRLFAKVLKETMRVDDVVARYGGEEFVVVLPGRSASEAVEAMQRLRARLAEAVAASDAPSFTTSFGVTDSSMGTTVTDIVRTADAALLAAKSQGRDRVVLAGATVVPAQAGPVDEPVDA